MSYERPFAAAIRDAAATEASTTMLLDTLLSSAPRGLERSFSSETGLFAHTLERSPETATGYRVAGSSLRYSAIAALGLATLPEELQRRVLAGGTARELATTTLPLAATTTDPGAFALACWAAAETGAGLDEESFARLVTIASDPGKIPTVDAAWVLTALVAVGLQGAARSAADTMARRIIGEQRAADLFPHYVPAAAVQRLRRHIGCFADQVYPIQALARYAAAVGDVRALRAAERCAAKICALQGRDGQWWWHYDVRTGRVSEKYPVYSVHQHAMAPMALIDLAQCGGADHSDSVALGLAWMDVHPEIPHSLIDEDLGVIWRSARRREPLHAARYLGTLATAVRPRARLSLIDRVFPPTDVDYECRPYELGWLLYAWRPRPQRGKP